MKLMVLGHGHKLVLTDSLSSMVGWLMNCPTVLFSIYITSLNI